MYHTGLPMTGRGVGPVLRYAVDLADPGRAQFGLAGGQSGHHGSVYYDDALEEWLAGRPRTLWTDASELAHQRTGSWELYPARE